MSYDIALRAAGAEVLEYETFGSYSGIWLAKVRLPGETEPKYIRDYFGSCSGCDSYQAECSDILPWDHKHGEEHIWSSNLYDASSADCPTCAEARQKVAAFGLPYLGQAVSVAAMERELIGKTTGDYVDDNDREALACFRRWEGLTDATKGEV